MRFLVRDVPHELRVRGVVDVHDGRAVPFHLAGDRVEDWLIVGLRIVGRLRIVAVVRREPDVDPVAIGRVGLRGQLESLAALHVVEPDQPHVLGRRRRADRRKPGSASAGRRRS